MSSGRATTSFTVRVRVPFIRQGQTMIGVLLGLSSAGLFGLGAVFAKIQQREMRSDDGHFMTVLVNVLLLGSVLPFLSLPRWDGTAFTAFLAAGILGTFMGRKFNLRAIRLVGPTHANVVLMSSPIFAAIAGSFLLHEGVGPGQAIGAGVVVVGLWNPLRRRLVLDRRPDQSADAEHRQAPASAPGCVIDPSPPRDRRGARRAIRGSHGSHIEGYISASLGAAFFGLGFAVRKWGMVRFPNAVAGALFGAIAALSLILVTSVASRDVQPLMRRNLRHVPHWFAAAGVATSFALISQFSAYELLPAWEVSLLQGTQALWTLLWSYLFTRRDEELDKGLLASVALVALGVAIMAIET